MKKKILDIVDSSVKAGLKRKQVCSLLQIDERRIQRWYKRGQRLEDINTGPVNAPHALLDEEKEAIRNFALKEEFIDDSHRVLAAKGADKGLFCASSSTVYKVMREDNLTADRSGRAHKSGRSTAPDRPQIDGPNQRWCWDISYCKTNVKGIFIYLFALLDEYSRKVISWRISWNITHKEAMELIQEGLDNESLSDIDIKMPDLINDRGTQMKAKAFMRMCRELGIAQKFSRPRTPNDNPFIESLFSIVKGYHRYPGNFKDDIEAITYFSSFFDYYNNERYHGKIGFVTPVQKHTGQDKTIIERRMAGLRNARKVRIETNKRKMYQQNIENEMVLV